MSFYYDPCLESTSKPPTTNTFVSKPVQLKHTIHSRRPIPSKWEEAEKWVKTSPLHPILVDETLSPHSPAQPQAPSQIQTESSKRDNRRTHYAKPSPPTTLHQPVKVGMGDGPCANLLKDKFMEMEIGRSAKFVQTSYGCNQVGLITEDNGFGSMKLNKDVSLSPEHDTPETSSAALSSNIVFEETTLANWNLRKEEGTMWNYSLKNVLEEKKKKCMRCRREEAKIQAWINLQDAKADAELKKLELKIEKMRANLEEKLMRRSAAMEKKAEKWRAAANACHSHHIKSIPETAITRKPNNPSIFHRSTCFT